MFRIRLDEKNGLDVPQYIDTMGATTYVLVHHVLPHGNPHYHAYLELDIKENTLRQRIKRLGYISSDFSIKKCHSERRDEYIQYLFNQKHNNVATLIKSHNFDDQLLHQLQVQAESIAREYEDSKTTKRTSRPTIYDLAEEVSQRLNQAIPMYNRNRHEFREIYRKALIIGIEVCKKHRQPFEEHYLRRLTVTAIAINDSNKSIGIVDKIMSKEFPL